MSRVWLDEEHVRATGNLREEIRKLREELRYYRNAAMRVPFAKGTGLLLAWFDRRPTQDEWRNLLEFLRVYGGCLEPQEPAGDQEDAAPKGGGSGE